MKKINGVDLLKTLVKLYSAQEGVKVNYKIEATEKGEKNGNGIYRQGSSSRHHRRRTQPQNEADSQNCGECS